MTPDIQSYNISKLMLAYSVFNISQIILHISHLYKIRKYYGMKISEPVWWNIENYTNIWFYVLMRIPYFVSLILGIILMVATFQSFLNC